MPSSISQKVGFFLEVGKQRVTWFMNYMTTVVAY